MRRFFRPLSTLLACCLLSAQTWATWSIVVVDLATGEVAVATATCLTNFDLRASVPVLVPEFGAAAHQSAVDVTGTNRLLNWQLLQSGTPVDEILQAIKDQDRNKGFRQIGIVSLRGDAITYSGAFTFDWKGGRSGRVGSLVYAIQGNGLAGKRVVTLCEAALRDSTGPLAERLLTAMDAANSMGGDGRCSCSVPYPDSCGTPPPGTWKGSHIATLLIGRPGDPIQSCTATGCAEGDIYMALNVAFANVSDPDPLITLRQQYLTWAAVEIGRPDAYQSDVFVSAPVVAPGSALVQLVVDLRNRDGTPLSNGGALLSLQHDASSAGSSTLTGVTDHLDGTYTLDIQPGMTTGVDRLRVIVDDGVRPVTLWPPSELTIAAAPISPWNDPQADSNLNSLAGARSLRLASDGLGGWLLGEDSAGIPHVYIASRTDSQSPFQLPVAQTDNFSPGWDLRSLAPSADGLSAILGAVAPGETVERLWLTSRATNTASFAEPILMTELDTGAGESTPFLSSDGLRLWFASNRGGTSKIWSADRASGTGRFLRPQARLVAGPGKEVAWPLLLASGTQLLVAQRSAGGSWIPRIADLGWSSPQLHSIPGGWPSLSGNVAPLAVEGNGDLWLSGSSVIARVIGAANSLTLTPSSLSATTGGTLSLQLDLGLAAANAPFRLLAGAPGGTSAIPGISAIAAFLPTQATQLSVQGIGLFSNGRGILDSAGQASITLSLPAGVLAQSHWLNRDYSLCALALGNQQAFVSSAALFRLNP